MTFGTLLLLILKLAGYCQGTELTFELPDRARECFYQEIVKGTQCSLEYQVSRSELVFYIMHIIFLKAPTLNSKFYKCSLLLNYNMMFV